MLDNQKEITTKTFYATVGAPVVIARTMRETGERLAGRLTEYRGKLTAGASAQIDDFAKEGEKVTKQLQGNTVVEELQSRVDLEKVQDRVEKLRDQLDSALKSWRESFTPDSVENVPVESPAEEAEKTSPKQTAKKTPAAKTGTSKAAGSKTATAKKAPTKTSG